MVQKEGDEQRSCAEQYLSYHKYVYDFSLIYMDRNPCSCWSVSQNRDFHELSFFRSNLTNSKSVQSHDPNMSQMCHPGYPVQSQHGTAGKLGDRRDTRAKIACKQFVNFSKQKSLRSNDATDRGWAEVAALLQNNDIIRKYVYDFDGNFCCQT